MVSGVEEEEAGGAGKAKATSWPGEEAAAEAADGAERDAAPDGLGIVVCLRFCCLQYILSLTDSQR